MADEMHESIHPDRMWINIENRLVIPLQCPTSISAKEVFSLKWIWLINVFLQHNTQIIRLIYLDISQLFTKEDKSYFVWPFGGALDINYGQSNNLTLVGQLLIFMAQFPKPV